MYTGYLLGASCIGIGHYAWLFLLENFKINNINSINNSFGFKHKEEWPVTFYLFYVRGMK